MIMCKISQFPEFIHKYVNFFKIKSKDGEREYPRYKLGKVPIEVLIDNNYAITRKCIVFGTCGVCKNVFECFWSVYGRCKRRYGRIICSKCFLKEVYSDENCGKKSSEYMKRPENRKKMSEKLKDIHLKNPEIGKKISVLMFKMYKDNPILKEKARNGSREAWKNEEHRDKCTGNGYHHGYYLKDDKKIYFASSWELLFLDWCFKNDEIIYFDRSKDIIPYEKPNGRQANYYPDFEIIWKNNSKSIIEIKGNKSNKDLVIRKVNAAEQYYKEKDIKYMILYQKDLKNMGILRKNLNLKDYIKNMVENGKVEYYGCGNGREKIDIV